VEQRIGSVHEGGTTQALLLDTEGECGNFGRQGGKHIDLEDEGRRGLQICEKLGVGYSRC
jgi:hypothetical protein